MFHSAAGRALAVAFAVLALGNAEAAAATITFDALPDIAGAFEAPGGPNVYTEAGFTVTGAGPLAYLDTPGSAYLADFGTAYAGGFTVTGGVFDAVSFTIESAGYLFFDTPAAFPDNIFVTGYSGGAVVATASYLLSDIVGTLQTFALGTDFRGIDALEITLAVVHDPFNCFAPCAAMRVDAVDVAPIPLPASGLLLAGAGLGLAGVAARRRLRGA